MRKANFIFVLAAILFCTANVQAQTVYERLVLEDAFVNEQPAQVGVVQNSGTGTLYIKNSADQQRETFFKISLDDLNDLTARELNYAKVELRYYTFRTNSTANTNAISVYPVTDNSWDETTLTWTNSRTLSADAISAGAIATAPGVRIAGYSGSGQMGAVTEAYNAANLTRIDISSYAIQQYKLGKTEISLMLHVTNSNGNGDQQIANRELATSVSNYELKRPKIIVTQPLVAANFTSPALGFVGESITFTNTSVMATSYLWDFGDGNTSTEASPVHTYAANGDYTVSLQINGNPGLTTSKAITVRTIADETLLGSDMEIADQGIWGITGASSFGVGSATWGNTVPATFGTDGYLYLQETNGTGTSYYIWQAVQLQNGSRYALSFDYAKGTFQKAWGEVYIGTALPGGSDYTDGGARGTNPMSWNNAEANTGTFINGTYNFDYDCTADGIYFFVIKVGTNNNGKFLFGIDNVTLTKNIDPVADFAALSYGFPGVPVQFTNNSINSVSYAWDFGDGETSTEENPSHTFATAGTYTVELISSDEFSNTSPITKQITVYPIHSEEITGTMDAADRDNWLEIGPNNITNTGNDKLIWGYDPRVVEGFNPADNFFGDGGFLTVCESWGGSDIYKIVQAVSLTAGTTYDISLDYALGWYNRTRGQVYLGATVPSASVYSDFLIATFLPYSENNPSGNTDLQHVAMQYTCEESGVYYLVVQWETGIGGDAGFRSAIDNVKLKEGVLQLPASANFTSPTLGFVDEPVSFINSSAYATSYLWDFGDGSDTSTEESPVHTYAANGDYIVRLQINGDTDLSTTRAITVRTIANETLLGGDMEAADKDIWGITGANTFGIGSATWGNTNPTTFGTDGYLYLQETDGTATQYYIWQAVQLKNGGRYVLSFDYAKGTFLKAWGEVYIGTLLPGGNDYTDGESRGTKPMAWANTEANTGTFVNGQYSFSYDCTADGVYFFIIKAGTNGNGKFLFGVDNVKLTKIVDPIADFTAPTYGFPAVPVQFTDNSLNADSYSWDFGDGTAASVDGNPSHTFANAGTYTVTLTITNVNGATDSASKQIKIYPIQSESITGTMDAADRDNWLEIGAKNITNVGNDKLIWGYDGDHNVEGFAPAENFFGDGGFLTVCEGWGEADIYKIVQAVSLTAGTTYDISLDYALGWYNRTRGEIYLGATAPSESLYTDNLVETFLPYAENNPSGGTTLQDLATQFNCTATGVYYFVIQWETGIGGSAGFRSAIDNVKLKAEPTGLSPVENSATVFANGGRIYVKSDVSSNKIDVYSALGQLVVSAKINSNYYESKVLTPGLYIVSVNGNVSKMIVK